MSRAFSLLLPLFFAASTVAAIADDAHKAPAEPPSRVGRISIIEGRLSVKMPGQENWAEAERNYPVTPDMEFVTDAGTRSELQLGGTTVSIGGRTAISIVALDDNATHLFLDDGSIDLRVHALGRGEHLIVETPDGSVIVQDTGIYRIDTSDRAHPMRVAAFDGSVDVETTRGRQGVTSDQGLDVNEEGQVHATKPEVTALDEWAQVRENEIGMGTSAQYVSSDVPGYEDLDAAGSWQVTKEYGALWFPTKLSADWAPYQEGHWSWVAPWGWTWIDSAAWGFAPFHYGRWINFEGRWGWSPGKRLRHPIYAPALVGFDGIDPSTFASKRQPPRRWVALGPNEVYRAPYTQDLGYLRKVNKGAVANEQLAVATWDTDEWPTFANVGHVHMAHLTLAPKLALAAPAKAIDDAAREAQPKTAAAKLEDENPPVDSEGHLQMVLRIPMDQARQMNLVPADANQTLRMGPPPMPDINGDIHVDADHDKPAEHAAKADEHASVGPHDGDKQPAVLKGTALPENLTHPELSDRSHLVDPLPAADASARPLIEEERLETVHPTPAQPPLSWPVHQQPAHKQNAAATNAAKPHVQAQHQASKDVPKDTTGDDTTED